MAGSVAEKRPTTFKACAACQEATNLLRAASLQVEPGNVSQLTVVCSKIHGKEDYHVATASMQIVRMRSDAGEEVEAKVLKKQIVYCAGVLQG